jgi:hypothetical protein
MPGEYVGADRTTLQEGSTQEQAPVNVDPPRQPGEGCFVEEAFSEIVVISRHPENCPVSEGCPRSCMPTAAGATRRALAPLP